MKKMKDRYEKHKMILDLIWSEAAKQKLAKRMTRDAGPKPRVFSVVTVIDALKWAYNPNHSPNLDASPNH